MNGVGTALVAVLALSSVAPAQDSFEDRLDAALAVTNEGGADGAQQLRTLTIEMETAIRENPTAELYSLLGRTYFYLEDDAAAGQALRKSLALDANHVEAIRFMGLLEFYGGRLEAAEEALRRAAKLAPGDSRAHMELGDVLERAGRPDEALASYEEAVQLAPDDPAILQRIAPMLAGAGDARRAAGIYESLIAIGIESSDSVYNLGQARQTLGEHEKALAAFERALELDPLDWRAKTKAVQELQALGRLGERDEWRDSLFQQRAESPGTELGRAQYYCRDQFLTGDVKVFAFEYFELVGENPRVYVFRPVSTATGEETLVISLGSADLTTSILRETGKLGPDERAYHLDSYSPDGLEHSTFAFFSERPSYDEVKDMVLKILADEGAGAISSSTIRIDR